MSCDLRNLDGGWTLIWSSDGGVANTTLIVQVPNGPLPGSNTALQVGLMQTLTANALEVHLRTPLPDGGLSGQWMTSLPATVPIANLRAAALLNREPIDTEASFYETSLAGWPSLTVDTGLCPERPLAGWPELFWACGNGSGLHINRDGIRWSLATLSNDPIEVYVR